MVLLPEQWGLKQYTKRRTHDTLGGPRRCKGHMAPLELQLPAHPQCHRNRGLGQPSTQASTSAALLNRAFLTALLGSLPGPYGDTFSLKDRRTEDRKETKRVFFPVARNNFFKARENISIRVLILLLRGGSLSVPSG